MAWDLGSWMVLVRSLQLVGCFVCAGVNGFLLAHITINRLGPSQILVSLEWIICLILCYTAINLLVLHTGRRRRSQRTSWLVFFVVMDVMCCGAILSVITLLARAGVPSNCAGLTRYDFQPGDKPNLPNIGDDGDDDHSDKYTTIRFSNELTGGKGQLDKLCAYERAYYFVAVALMFSYTAIIVLSVLRICESKYTPNKRVLQTMGALHPQDSYEMAPKLESSCRNSHSPSPQIPPPAPQSEGFASRRTSIRPPSRMPQGHHHAVAQSIPERIPSMVFASPRAHPASPVSPVIPEPPASPPPPLGLGIASDNSADSLAAAAMITDGAQFGGGYQPGMSTLPPYSASSLVHPTPVNGSADNLGYNKGGGLGR